MARQYIEIVVIERSELLRLISETVTSAVERAQIPRRDEVLTKAEAAGHLNKSNSTVSRLMKQGLPSHGPGRPSFRLSELNAWMVDQANKPPANPPIKQFHEQVYLVRAEGTNHYKIGFTTALSKRFSALGTGCPHPLLLLAVRDGSMAMERAIHDLLAEYRKSGEWFECDNQEFMVTTFREWQPALEGVADDR